MEVRFNVTKEARRALVAAVSEITDVKSEYQGAPSFAFKVGGYIIDRNGTLIYEERTVFTDVRSLLAALDGRGFAFEGDAVIMMPCLN